MTWKLIQTQESTGSFPMISAATEKEIRDVKELCNNIITLIRSGKFTIKAISYQLLKDVITWHCLDDISAMRYSTICKDFMWAGKCLFGSQFLRFLQGLKFCGLISQGKVVPGG